LDKERGGRKCRKDQEEEEELFVFVFVFEMK
jgi:hypothetical protein